MPIAAQLKKVPRTNAGFSLRRSLLLSTVVVQSLLLIVFIALTTMWQVKEQTQRAARRLQMQADLLAAAVELQLSEHDVQRIQQTTELTRESVFVRAAEIVDLTGRAIAHTDPSLAGTESLGPGAPEVLRNPEKHHLLGKGRDLIAAAPVKVNGKVAAVAVVEPDWTFDHDETMRVVEISIVYGLLALMANTLASFWIARSVSEPVVRLLRGTHRVAEGEDIQTVFPMEVRTGNEVGRLIEAFNAMAQTLVRQRAGLNDTLSLLDSMLTNAPIGFAFFDRRCRFVRLNQSIADIHGASIPRHLGKAVTDAFHPDIASLIEDKIQLVFDSGETLRDVEFSYVPEASSESRVWLANFFPVRTAEGIVRWVGMIMTEVTERRKTEETLRRTEKLAAAGRLAASIAHEINNPLEGVTNLLYLLRQQPMDEAGKNYIAMAEHEVARVAEITQQTLRFHRQSTAATDTDLREISESVLSLYHGRLLSTHVTESRRFRGDTEIYGYSGELRQVVANLVSNAIDAANPSGKIFVRAAQGRHWTSGEEGVRVTVADTGCGMDANTLSRMFEPFFTTKDATGTGLGLWVSVEILRKHRAAWRVKSQQGKGTVFYIFFPAQAIAEAERTRSSKN